MRYAIAIAMALTAGQAFAQDTGWSFKASPYLWLPNTKVGISTPRGNVNGELGIEDAVQALDFAFMGSFEAYRNKWSLIGDLLYLNLEEREDTPFGGLFTKAEVGTQITAFTGLAAYRVYEDDGFSLDFGGGFRSMSLEADVVLSGGLLPTESSSRSDDWIDPIVALRGRYDFDEKWFGTLYVDGGGFGVGSEQTYQVAATVGYNLNEQWSLVGGWRYLDFKRVKNGNTLDFGQSGIVLGASYRF